MSLVRFDPSFVMVKQSFIVSTIYLVIVSHSVVACQFCLSPLIGYLYGAGNC